VKIDPDLLLERKADKENVQPLQLSEKSNQVQKPAIVPGSFSVGQIVFVLRSDESWSQGAVAECTPEMLTVVLQQGGQKQIPAECIDGNIRPLTEEQNAALLLARQAAVEVVEREETKSNEVEKPVVAPGSFTVGQIVFVLRSDESWSQGAVAECNPDMLTVVLQEGGQKQIPAECIDGNVRPLTEEQHATLLLAQKSAEEAEEAEMAEHLRQAAQREAEEKARNEQEAADRAAELAAAQAKVDMWCKSNGFKDAMLQKKTLRGATKFPLHTAVKHKDEEMVKLLMQCGADQTVLSSKKQTPRQLAAKINKGGSHDQILAMLC